MWKIRKRISNKRKKNNILEILLLILTIIAMIFKGTENKEMAKKFANIIIEENEEIIENIKNKDKNRLSKLEILQYLEEQKKIYKEAKKVNEGL